MSSIPERILTLVTHASESLTVELKAWFDPSESRGIGKLATSCLALRNNNGGYLLVGFDNATGQPLGAAPFDVQTLFHADAIQNVIGRYASDPFEVTVYFVDVGGVEYPILEIPSGIRTPVAARSDLKEDTNWLVRTNRIYVRSLTSNNTVSTTELAWRDLPRLMETCFENREADIGRFLRRHLVGLSSDSVSALAEGLTKMAKPPPSLTDEACSFLAVGEASFNGRLHSRQVTLPPHGALELTVVLDPGLPAIPPTSQLLSGLMAQNPELSGWPMWIDSRTFGEADWPYVYEDAWEALVVSESILNSAHIDFWRIEPRGRFYLRRAFRDDLTIGPGAPTPLTQLDFGGQVTSVVEAIAVALEFGRYLTTSHESAMVGIAARWRGLTGRELSSWMSTRRHLGVKRKATQDSVVSTATVPLTTQHGALVDVVDQLLSPMFAVFDGFVLSHQVAEELVMGRLQRRH